MVKKGLLMFLMMLPTFMFAQGELRKYAWPLTIVNGIKYGINEKEGYAEVRWMMGTVLLNCLYKKLV